MKNSEWEFQRMEGNLANQMDKYSGTKYQPWIRVNLNTIFMGHKFSNKFK